MTEEEATEAMQVAMTVGATRMQVMLNTEQTKLGVPQAPPAPAAVSTAAAPADAPPEPMSAPGGTGPGDAAPKPATFTAAEVVPQAGGG